MTAFLELPPEIHLHILQFLPKAKDRVPYFLLCKALTLALGKPIQAYNKWLSVMDIRGPFRRSTALKGMFHSLACQESSDACVEALDLWRQLVRMGPRPLPWPSVYKMFFEVIRAQGWRIRIDQWGFPWPDATLFLCCGPFAIPSLAARCQLCDMYFTYNDTSLAKRALDRPISDERSARVLIHIAEHHFAHSSLLKPFSLSLKPMQEYIQDALCATESKRVQARINAIGLQMYHPHQNTIFDWVGTPKEFDLSNCSLRLHAYQLLKSIGAPAIEKAPWFVHAVMSVVHLDLPRANREFHHSVIAGDEDPIFFVSSDFVYANLVRPSLCDTEMFVSGCHYLNKSALAAMRRLKK